jgi:hypothetical protein
MPESAPPPFTWETPEPRDSGETAFVDIAISGVFQGGEA